MDMLAFLLGPLVALVAGLAGWAAARRHAPPRAANDNAPRFGRSAALPVERLALPCPAAFNDRAWQASDAAG